MTKRAAAYPGLLPSSRRRRGPAFTSTGLPWSEGASPGTPCGAPTPRGPSPCRTSDSGPRGTARRASATSWRRNRGTRSCPSNPSLRSVAWIPLSCRRCQCPSPWPAQSCRPPPPHPSPVADSVPSR
ncbi:MAG: hypothetical protein B7Z68_10380 [Acidobacteria bacterium 21-70-11]|nr:MAG: hypothetical protein B7Z68_10380 [Acidobacteria bacterium 21-70-11]